jgi:hypothetical protein
MRNLLGETRVAQRLDESRLTGRLRVPVSNKIVGPPSGRKITNQ